MEQYTETISGEESVLSVLQSLIDERVVCTMAVSRLHYIWITMLLQIVRIQGISYLSIDRVAGFESIFLRFPDLEVSLEFMDKEGVPCHFNCKIVASRSKDILSELPKVIYRSQRRKYFRIAAPLGTEISFRTSPSEEIEKTKVLDYSAGGIAFMAGGDLRFGVGDLLYDIHLTIPAGAELVHFHIPQAAVRRIEFNSYRVGGKTLCAIEFLEISNETRNNIISHIFRQQRASIQRIGR